jgi:hypothetical protein
MNLMRLDWTFNRPVWFFREHPALRTPWLIIVAMGLFVAGCGQKTAPDYDGIESRVLADALQGLTSAEPSRSVSALEKLADVDPDSRLSELAIAHERDRELVVRLNQHLQNGELAEAAEILRYQRRFGDMGTSLMAWSELPDELRAIQLYVEAKPFRTSDDARKALARLDEQRKLLDKSPSFLAFRAEQNQEVARLVAWEKDRVARSLLADLDALVLVGDARADEVLAEIVATVGPDHPLPATVEAVALGDWRKVRELSEPGQAGVYRSEYLEIAFAMFWDELSDDVRQALGRGLMRLPPCTLSGLLLHIRYAAKYGRMDDAVIYLRELSSSVQLTPEAVGRIMESLVLPREAFLAPCWRTSCPSVTDILGRIDQLRDHIRASRE